MSTNVFPVISVRRSLRGMCPVCLKTVTRSKTFEMTVNPFNRDANGNPKSHSEVRHDVNAEADAWVPDFLHDACRAVSA